MHAGARAWGRPGVSRAWNLAAQARAAHAARNAGRRPVAAACVLIGPYLPLADPLHLKSLHAHCQRLHRTQACDSTRPRTHRITYTYTHTCACTHTRTHARARAHTHTHTRAPQQTHLRAVPTSKCVAVHGLQPPGALWRVGPNDGAVAAPHGQQRQGPVGQEALPRGRIGLRCGDCMQERFYVDV
jgi:hypothetical protein